MRRMTLAAIIALVAVPSVAVPARADAPGAVDCTNHLLVQEPPSWQSFSIDLQTLQVRLQPEAVDDDALMVVDLYLLDAVRFAVCVEGGTVTEPVRCLLDNLEEILASMDPLNGNLRYVYQDPMTGEIVIDGGRLLADIDC